MEAGKLNALIAVLSAKTTKLDKKIVDRALKEKYLDETYKYNLPECEVCGNKLDFRESLEDGGSMYVCPEGHVRNFTKQELMKYNTLHLNLDTVITQFVDVAFNAEKIKTRKPLEFGLNSQIIELDGGQSFITTFLLDETVSMENLGYLALWVSKQRIPWICFYNKVFCSKNKDEFHSLISSVPLGLYVLSININDWFKNGEEAKGMKSFNEQLQTYRELYGKIKAGEDQLLAGIKIKDLVYSIDTNPKLILTLAMKFMFDRSSLNWQDFQNLAKISFSIMYHSDLKEGGRPFKHEPDFIFKYVEETTSSSKLEARRIITHFFGIGDSKLLGSGKALKLSDELTEKYLDYFRYVRNEWAAEADKIVELIIFYNSDFSLKAEDFVNRLYESDELIPNKDLIVFLDSWAFLPFMTKYLSIIEKSTKYTSKETQKEKSSLKPEDLLHPETLNKNFAKTTKKGGNVYYLVDISALKKLYPID